MWCDLFLLLNCFSGLYGKECNLNCSQFCHGKVCYQTTGECVNGCKDGYIGGLCTIRKIWTLIHDKFFCIIYIFKLQIEYNECIIWLHIKKYVLNKKKLCLKYGKKTKIKTIRLFFLKFIKSKY